MNLSEALSPSRIKRSMTAKNRWEAIDELVDILAGDGTIAKEKRQVAIDSVVAREKKMSTGIGFGIAIPHAASAAVEKVVIAMGLSPAGIDFEALDGKPVHIVVLLLVPAEQYDQNLKTLASLSRLMNGKKFRKQLEKAESPEAIWELFKSKDH